MRKSVLLSVLLILLTTTVNAESIDPLARATLNSYAQVAANSIKQIDIAERPTHVLAAASTTTPTTSTTTTTEKVAVPANTTSTTTTTTPAVTTTTTPVTTTTPATTTTTAPVPATGTVSMAQPINCNYRIPAETTNIAHAIITQWADNATRQSFDLDHVNITQQLTNLRACYTEPGWHSFNEALTKSGNLNAIKTQKLMVTSTVDGHITVTDIKENQWRVTVPLKVTYQSEKQQLVQHLTVDLVIGRKITGDLGIMQIIASPRQTVQTTTQPSTAIIKQPTTTTTP